MARDHSENISPGRSKHLERNRIAANKCRQKKKKEHQKIQNSLHDETARHDSLMAELNSLREEVWTLKNTVFAHASCNDWHINRKLASMSESLTGSSPEQLHAQLPSPTFSSQSCSDASAVESGAVEPNVLASSSFSSDGSGPLPLMDPALFDQTYNGVGTPEFGFDRLIDMENL
ncbi:hypothetical protein N7533_003199 [Penicillium manginii]|jgi:hypothetical protein|uniref:uncharacterized protein n=1 Tax=Penicillium manginii TaxID=203109 RepID=UPI002549B1B2|nr:uncharacterized protein N7533_003199 [Penicillium manginii]KAJ5764518.1 hypothetical protein N7533_003199 [Penicillium manginii]